MAFFEDSTTEKVNNSLWVEKYRPRKLDEYVGNEQLKQIEVQKLVEESEKALIDELFDEPTNIQPTINIQSSTNIQPTSNKQQPTTVTNIDKYNHKIAHELKQKALAKSAKELKLKQQRDAEVYG